MKYINTKNIVILVAFLVVIGLIWYFKSSHKQDTVKEVDFQAFVHKLNIIELPFTSTMDVYADLKSDDALKDAFLALRTDTIYCDKVVGLLSDTSNFYVILWQMAVDWAPPYISIFSKSGKFISDVPLYIEENYGDEPEFSNNGFTLIDKKYNLQIVDTITERVFDSTNYVPTKYYISKTLGKINKNGVVKFSKPLTFDLDIKDVDKNLGK